MNQKLILTFTFLLLIFCTNISLCQFKNFGIKAGLNLSSAKIDYHAFNIEQPKNKIGYTAGIFYDYPLGKNFIISGEAAFSNRGYKSEIIITDEFGNELGRENITYNLNYIDFSVLPKYIFRNKTLSPYFSAGPVIAFKTGYKVHVPGINEDITDGLLDTLNKTTFGVKGGVGMEINKIIPQTLIAEIRYYTDIKNSFSNDFVTFKRNTMWELNLGIKF